MRSSLCALLALGILLGGCSAHTQWSVSSGGRPPPVSSPPPPGTSVTSSSAGLQIQSSGRFAAVIVAVSLLAAAIDWSREERAFPDPSSLVSPAPPRAPALSSERPVREQDCSQPIVDSYSNLRCR